MTGGKCFSQIALATKKKKKAKNVKALINCQ